MVVVALARVVEEEVLEGVLLLSNLTEAGTILFLLHLLLGITLSGGCRGRKKHKKTNRNLFGPNLNSKF